MAGGGVTRPCSLTVERPGLLTTVQDAGRPGLAHLGVPRSGALDPAAHRLANRLAGNPETAPVLETTLDGVTLRFSGPAAVAVTGAVAPLRLDGRHAGWGVPVLVRPGQVLDVGRATAGVRCYLAVSGGFALPTVLGSVATDLLSGLGPAPLVAGQTLPVGAASADPAVIDLAPYEIPSRDVTLPIHRGPRDSWLTADGWSAMTTTSFTVAAASNRIGLRLVGGPVGQAARGELPSEGLVWGAIQVLPDGGLVVFLADHPTTGGYPVAAVVDPAGFSACAQSVPGTTVRFKMVHTGRG
ncbi:MAG TPA: biotin-dependent carboxyltransferase family protein [Streptosporangiaceae bacterium]|nr:biotin-dependent carboxyltransferase family protein [Streptosporangiaceae bacterium]